MVVGMGEGGAASLVVRAGTNARSRFRLPTVNVFRQISSLNGALVQGLGPGPGQHDLGPRGSMG